MKRKLLCLLAAACLAGSCACFASCGENEAAGGGESEGEHVHQYVEQVTAPTRTTQGSTLYSCSCGDSYREYLGALHKEMPKSGNYSFLFVGNSYTYYNQLWTIFADIAEEERFENVETEFSESGTLADVASPTDPMGAALEALLSKNHYDFVFLQEQSLRPAIDSNLFFGGVKALHDRIEKTGARDVLHMTWGRKEGSADLETQGLTYEEHAQKMIAAYKAIGEKLGIPVSNVGEAFYIVNRDHPEIELYKSDKTHPSTAGSYLAALCHYATVFGRSPVGIEYTGGCSEEEVSALQKAAHEAVFGKSVLKDEYRIDPESVKF